MASSEKKRFYVGFTKVVIRLLGYYAGLIGVHGFLGVYHYAGFCIFAMCFFVIGFYRELCRIP